MKQALLEHIEAKVINSLRDTKAPMHASRIAVQIQERREDALQAIQRLVRNRTLKSIQDLTLLNSTGETMAYTLADPMLQPTPIAPVIPIPPSPPTSPSQRDSIS